MNRPSAVSMFGWLAVSGLCLPVLLTVWVSFSPDRFLTLPSDVWSLKWYEALWDDRRWMAAAARSLSVGLMSALLCVTAAAAAVLALRRLTERFRHLILASLILPGVIPPAALGMGLLPLVHRSGLWGTATVLVLVHATLGLPVAVLMIRLFASLQLEELEAVARGLGASRRVVCWRVTLPLLKPGLIAAGVAVFLLSLNESLLTLFLATPDNETLPALIWPQLRFSVTPLVAAASSLMGVLGSAGLLAAFRLFRTSRRIPLPSDR